MEITLLILYSFASVFFLFTSFVILHNKRHFRKLHSGFHVNDDSGHLQKEEYPDISILIPARNEENNISKLLESLENQDYPTMEILVLDDGSTDQTASIAEKASQTSRFPITVIHGEKRPDGWLGKNWACHQLSRNAAGKIWIFLDADTWLSPHGVSSIVYRMHQYQLDFSTVWPHQVMRTLPEKTIISTVYATIATYLPTNYCYKAPWWIPFPSLREKVKPLFASACGQCMVFTKACYETIGGHSTVKGEVVEDVTLARIVVKSGLTMRMFHGTDTIWCRMYRSHKEILQGLRKNFFAGFGNRYLPFFASWIGHIAVYLMPPIIFISEYTGLIGITSETMKYSGIAVILTAIPFLQRLWVGLFLKWPLLTALLHIPGVLWFQMLAFIVVRDHFFHSTVQWKGRNL